MKKLSLLLFATVCFLSLKAQKFEGGISGGLNFSQLDGDLLSGYNKLGLNAGFWVSFPFDDKWSGGLEFLFSQKGAQRSINEENIASTRTFDRYRINYIDVPLYMGYTYKKFTFQAGLVGEVLISAKVEDFTGTQDFTDQFKRLNTGFLLGTSYPINKNLSAQLRYHYTIFSLSKNDTRTVFTDNAFSPLIVGLYNNFFAFALKFRVGG